MSTDLSESPAMLVELPTANVPTLEPRRQIAPKVRPQTGSAAEASAESSHSSRQAASTPTLAADLVQLTKPRIVSMILITTVASACIAGASDLSLVGWIILLASTALVAGSAGAANQVWERVIDRRMTRTAVRPLSSGRRSLGVGVAFTALTGVLGTTGLWWQFGWQPAMVGVVTWLMYVTIYTPMKTRTPWNTTVGALAGALPIWIGYTALGGDLWHWTPWMLLGVLAFWQYPHFMAIAWLYRRQYADAGFQMTTTADPTGGHAAIQSVLGSAALISCALVACLHPGQQWTLSIGSLVACGFVLWSGWILLGSAIRFASQRTDQTARSMMRASLVVLPTVLLVVTLRVALA